MNPTESDDDFLDDLADKEMSTPLASGDRDDGGFEDERTKGRKRRRMMCFECNRPEGHFLAIRYRWFFSYLLGLTFGLITFVGPYQCQCCGNTRLMSHNRLNLRYWARVFREKNLSTPKKRKQSRKF